MGIAVGSDDGVADGFSVGETVGWLDGSIVGLIVGFDVGFDVGSDVGAGVGDLDGAAVGLSDAQNTVILYTPFDPPTTPFIWNIVSES